MAKKQIIPKRGEVYLVNFDPTLGSEIKKTRPALILQNNIANRYGSTTIVAALTGYDAGESEYPSEVLVQAPEGGLAKDSLVLLSQIRTIDKQRLLHKLGRLKSETMLRVEKALLISLGMIKI